MSTVYTVNGKVLKNAANDKWLAKKEGDPYNPLNLPSNTVRVRTSNGNAPTKDSYTTYETATLVAGTTDVYDVYKSGTSFSALLRNSSNVVEVLGANTTDVDNMESMFIGCSALTTVALFDTSSVTTMFQMFTSCNVLQSVPLFDTSSVTTMASMFYYCGSLTAVPTFNTSSVTTMDSMFRDCSALTTVPLFNTSSAQFTRYMLQNCRNVQSGALALYQQTLTQATQLSNHYRMFYNCGIDTTTGAAELAQIPSDWK